LNRRFNVPNALDGDTVLVVAVDKLILKFANFINQDAKFISNIRDILVTPFSPERELLLRPNQHIRDASRKGLVDQIYRYIHPLPRNHLHTSHYIFFHLHQLGELLGEIRPEGTGSLLAECMA
jgi:hypothetical protein